MRSELLGLSALISLSLFSHSSVANPPPSEQKVELEQQPPKKGASEKTTNLKINLGTKAVDAIIDGIQGFYRNAKDLKANFKQTYTYIQMGRKQNKSGRVFFKKPGKMRWDYAEPEPQVFVADGETLWVYQPNEAQAFKQPLKSAQLPVALTFMGGEGELRDEFEASLVASTDETPDTHQVRLIPKESEVNYKAVILTVRKSDFSVVSSTVVDPVGNLNQLVFADVKTNSDIPDRAFDFDPPQGVEIIDAARPR